MNSVYIFLTPSYWALAAKQAASSGNVTPAMSPAVIWAGFKEQTTAHGLPRLNASGGPLKKVFWFTTMLLSSMLLIYNFINITTSFFSYQADVKIEIKQVNELAYPAITLCNMNPVRRSALQEAGLVEESNKKRRKKRAVGCDTGWTDYNDRCYFVSTTTKSFSKSRTYCQGLGAELASIGDVGIRNFLDTITSTESGRQYWVGLYKSGSSWGWLDGTPLSYTNWFSGEPNGSGPCSRVSSSDKWKDMACSTKYYCICEKTPPTTTTMMPTTIEPTTVEPTTTTQSTTEAITTTVPVPTTTEIVTTTEQVPTTTEAITTTVLTTTEAVTTTEPVPTTTEALTTTEPVPTTSEAITTTESVPTTTEAVTTTEPVPTTTEAITTTESVPTTTEVVTTTEPVLTTTEALTTTEPVPTTTEAITTTEPVPTTTEAITTIEQLPTTTEAVTTTEPVQTTTDAITTTEPLPTTEPDPTRTEAGTTTGLTTQPTTQPKQKMEKCCCTCCEMKYRLYTSTPVCNTCGATDVQDAAKCANNILYSPTAPPLLPHTTIHTLTTATTESDKLSSVAKSTQTTSKEDIITTESSQGKTTTKDIHATTATLYLPTQSHVDNQPPTEGFPEAEKITELIAGMDEEDKKTLGFQGEDMILDCQFSGYTCGLKNFEQFHNPTHGNCFIFNSGWNTTESIVRKASRTGRRYGLHLIMNVDQREYLPQTADTVGLRVVVHPQSRMPFPEDEGITVGPGRSTSIGIRQVVVDRLGPPHGSCTDPTLNHSDKNVYEELYPVGYSASACKKSCYQRHVIAECGCGDPYYPLYGAALCPHAAQSCRSDNQTEDDCRQNVQRKFNLNSLDCDCESSCRDVAFSLEVSMGMWPSNVQKDAVLSRLEPQIASSFDSEDPKEYKKNLIKLEIYYEQFNFESVREVPAYSPSNYLSHIGGALGLCIGFSLLTIGEIVEFMMDLTILFGLYLHKKLAPRTNVKISHMEKLNREKRRWQRRMSSTTSSQAYRLPRTPMNGWQEDAL